MRWGRAAHLRSPTSVPNLSPWDRLELRLRFLQLLDVPEATINNLLGDEYDCLEPAHTRTATYRGVLCTQFPSLKKHTTGLT